jgi:hypothetical protein
MPLYLLHHQDLNVVVGEQKSVILTLSVEDIKLTRRLIRYSRPYSVCTAVLIYLESEMLILLTIGD